MKDVNGKCLRRAHYTLLRQLGIEIVLYDLKTYPGQAVNGMHQLPGTSSGFEVHGGFTEDVDFDELFALLVLLKAARDSSSPAIKDALEQLNTVIGLANDESK